MSKLTDYPCMATLPAQDMERARKFYEETLGFKVASEDDGGVAFESAGMQFYVFKTFGKPSGDHTQLNFEVDSVAAVVADLKGRGVTMETYDMEGFKSDEDGIVEIPGSNGGKGAWFKDTEGNLLALSEGM